MASQLVGLKLRLLRNSFRRSPWQIVFLILGTLYGLLWIGVAAAGLIALRVFGDVPTVQAVTTLAGAALLIAWLVLPLLFFGADATLDPASFAQFGIPSRKLVVGLFAASFVSVPVILTVLYALLVVVSWTFTVADALAAVIGAALAVVLAIVLCRAGTTLAASALSTRRSRDITTVIVLVLLVLIGPGIAFVTMGVGMTPELFEVLETVFAWTPFGAPWAIPADVHAGAWGFAALKLVESLVVIALCAWAWVRGTRRAMESRRKDSGGDVRVRSKNGGMFGRLPGKPWGAVAARSLIYWRRDPRYFGSLGVMIVLPFVFLAMGTLMPNSGNFFLSVPAVVLGFIVGFGPHADISYDGTAFALHVQTSLRGFADRLGRMVPYVCIGLPLILVIVVVELVMKGGPSERAWAAVIAELASALCVMFAGLGLSSIVGAWIVYPTPAPGEGAFARQPGGGVRALVQFGVMFGSIILALPVFIPAGMAGGNLSLALIALAVSLVLSAIYAVVGLIAGGKLFDRRAPVLFEMIAKQAR